MYVTNRKGHEERGGRKEEKKNFINDLRLLYSNKTVDEILD